MDETDESRFRMVLYLPAQAATETEATILAWRVAEGDIFGKGDALAEVDSAKSVFDFEAPCDGTVVRLLRPAGDVVELTEAVVEIETSDQSMRDWIPPAVGADQPAARPRPVQARTPTHAPPTGDIALRGLGGYLPTRIVTNAELVRDLPDLSEDYVLQVTGIRHRHWATEDEKPSDMALAAAEAAIRSAELRLDQIDAVIVATTTPDVAMPSTACILQHRLGLRDMPDRKSVV